MPTYFAVYTSTMTANEIYCHQEDITEDYKWDSTRIANIKSPEGEGFLPESGKSSVK